MCARAGAAVSVRGRARSIHDVIPKLARSKKVGVIVFVPMLSYICRRRADVWCAESAVLTENPCRTDCGDF